MKADLGHYVPPEIEKPLLFSTEIAAIDRFHDRL